MVAREVQRPGAADQQQAAEGAGIEGTLAPVDAAYLALVEARQFGFREDHPAEQLIDEARTAAAEGWQCTAGQAELTTDAGGERVETFAQLRRAGQVEAPQLAGTLVTVASEGQFDKQAQMLADLPQLMGEVEDAATALGIALLMHAQDHLAVKPA